MPTKKNLYGNIQQYSFMSFQTSVFRMTMLTPKSKFYKNSSEFEKRRHFGKDESETKVRDL